MCIIQFIDLGDAPYSVCQYVMARFVIFCFFTGVSVLYGLCITDIEHDNCIFKLLWIALGLEVLGVVVALCYAALAVVLLTELVCTVLNIFCCCCIFPLVRRSMHRRRMIAPLNDVLVSTTLMSLACQEACVICCGVPNGQVAAEAVVPGEVSVTTSRSVKSDVFCVLSMARMGVNVV
jgi:hypothetical protein